MVIRCEQIEGTTTAAADDEPGPVLLVRVQLSVGDRPPEILGPLVARRQDAGRLVAGVLDRVFEALAAQADQSGDRPTSSDS